MEKAQKSKWFIWTGLILGLLIITIGYISYKQTGKVDYKEVVALFASGGALFGIIIGTAFSSSSTSNVSDMKKDISIIKNEQISLKNNLSEVEMTITKKDLADAEKFQINFNGMRDIKNMMDDRVNIDNLGKSVLSISKAIIKKHWKINDELKDFLRKLSKQFSEYITKQYKYGLHDLDIYEYELTLYDEINALIDTINNEEIDIEAFEEVKNSLFFNVHIYIKNLNGIQTLSNGKRRERFEIQTKEFIKIMSHQSADAYINFVKETV